MLHANVSSLKSDISLCIKITLNKFHLPIKKVRNTHTQIPKHMKLNNMDLQTVCTFKMINKELTSCSDHVDQQLPVNYKYKKGEQLKFLDIISYCDWFILSKYMYAQFTWKRISPF